MLGYAAWMAEKMQSTRRSSGKLIGVLILAIWVIFVGSYVFRMIRAGERESAVTVTPDFIEVQSAHGVRIPIGKISDIHLKEHMPKVGRKVSGYNSFSCVKKGEFKLEGMGTGKIYIFTRQGPFLHIYTPDQAVIIAFRNPAKTKQLYAQIKSQRDGGQ